VKDLLEGLAVTQPDGRPRVDALPTHLSMSRQLGCGREMVTRVMNELVLEGYIRVEGRRLWILRKLPDKW
jgi:CRP/FNR family cyclic AMP-dependent transcriptional regulator